MDLGALSCKPSSGQTSLPSSVSAWRVIWAVVRASAAPSAFATCDGPALDSRAPWSRPRKA
jgi:hypothetical protein